MISSNSTRVSYLLPPPGQLQQSLQGLPEGLGLPLVEVQLDLRVDFGPAALGEQVPGVALELLLLLAELDGGCLPAVSA